MDSSSLIALKIMYAVAVVGAGVAGAITLLAPAVAGRYVFNGAAEVDVFLRILGALWLAIGVVALAGMVDPLRYLPLLVVQLIYKSVWLAVAAYPALATGRTSGGLVLLTALFTAWVLALLAVIPFRALVPSAA